MIKFPYYDGFIGNSNALGLISLEDFIDSHKKPTKQQKQLLSNIRAASYLGDKNTKAKFKVKLKAFTPSVIIKPGESRKYANIQSFTGLMQIDLDKIPTKQEAIDLKEHIFHSHNEIVCAYLSPSMLGVKFLLKIKPPAVVGGVMNKQYGIDKFKAMHKAVESEFQDYNYFDTATKNPILPLFASVDEDLLYRDYDKCTAWTKENWKSKKLNSLDVDNGKKYEYNKNHNVNIEPIIDAIKNIIDNGHPQVVKASLIMGSRVGAGYITQLEAENLLEHLIKNNAYLQKGIANYIKTSKWGIKEGMKRSQYF